MGDRVFFSIVFGYMSGVALRSFFYVGAVEIVCVLVFAVLTAVASYIQPFPRMVCLLLSLGLFASVIGVVRFDSVDGRGLHPLLAQHVGEEVALEGIVIDEPDMRENSTRLILLPELVGEEHVRTTERVLVSTARSSEYAYGDRISVRGKLDMPERFLTETGREFAYDTYLKKDGILSSISFAEVTILETGAGNPVYAVLFAIKKSFLEVLAALVPDPEVSLLGGLLVGAKESLGGKLMEQFRQTGVVHIVVLSGYNLTIIASSMLAVLYLLPRRVSLLTGGISIALFAAMTGGSATVVRAALMAILVLVAQATGRIYDVVKALVMAAFLMVLYSPYVLIFDPSFQLSCIATLGLILLSPILEERLSQFSNVLGLRSIVVATVSTQIFVLPLLLYMSGTLSLVSLPANLLVLVAVPFAMFFGFLAGALAFIHNFLALPFAYLAYGLLHYIIVTVELLASLPFASVTVPAFPWWLMILCYVLLGLYLRWLYLLRKP